MKSFLYFLTATVLIFGLLMLGGYIGAGHKVQTGYSPTGNMAKLVTGDQNATGDSSSDSGGCTSCRWY